jgi:hypothetical protein
MPGKFFDPVDKEFDRDERTADQEAGGAADRLLDPDEGRHDHGGLDGYKEDPEELGGEG